MTTEEFSNSFDTLLNSYNTQALYGDQASRGEVVLDEYEKSVYLTKAQEDVVVALYNGKNPSKDTFEGTEEMRRYLNNLVKTYTYTKDDQEEEVITVSSNSIVFELPSDIAFITMEQVTFDDESLGCYNGSVATVYPMSQDAYGKVKNNPFRGPTKYKVLRLDSGNGNTVELISKYKIGQYLIKYLSKPEPIILEDLTNGLSIGGKTQKSQCKVNPLLHSTILDTAVLLALKAKGVGAKS